MYRGTGTEKQMMQDPTTASSRIYVGHLAENVTKQDLETHFQKYGAIVGTMMNRGFGFIQFENELSAANAIKNENQCDRPWNNGRKLVVRHALKGFVNANRGRGGSNDGTPNRGGRGDNDMAQSRPGRGGGEVGRIDMQGRDNFNKNRGGGVGNRGGFDNNNRGGRGRGVRSGGNGGSNVNQDGINDRDRSPLNMNDRGSNEWRDNTGGGGFGFNNKEKQLQFGESPYTTSNNTFMPAINNFPKAPERPPPVAGSSDSNDCEIIVVSKALTGYAEFIEDRLKRIGLSVDLLFPNEDVPIGRVLGNISSRGCLYAILVMPQNEEHRSLTLNILHGLPQEHRNMPVDDAISLIDRNFKSYMRGDKTAVPNAVPIIPAKASMASLQDRHPENIQSLINVLADNRALTVLQYDKIIRYLQERRELQVKLELGEGSEMETDATPNKTQQELQNRILSILNKTSGGSPTSTVPDVASTPVAHAQPTSTTATPLLNDPTVQKALDSLLQGNLLQNLSGNSRF